jgi:hypothetical protein
MRSRIDGGAAALALVAAAALAVAAPAAADWLVTRGDEGGASRVETRGPWEVRGRLVVFHTADGQLASLRLEQVDLEASREATLEAEEAGRREAEAAPAPPRERPARRRITDADIPRGSGAPPAPRAADAADAGEATAGAEDRGTARTLVVLTSQGVDTGDGHARISGTLANHGQEPVVALALTVELFDYEGGSIASRSAEIASSALSAGDVTSFIVDFPDVYSYAATSFEPRGTRLATSAPDTAPGEGGAEGGDSGSPP